MRRGRDPESEPIEVSNFVAEVGQRVKLMRLARNITQADMAERADMSRTTLNAIESGALSTRFSDVARVLWVLDDLSLQKVMSVAEADETYREAAQAALRKSARHGGRSQ